MVPPAALAGVMGWGSGQPFRWPRLFAGLDDCWLALIAFCAAHALVGHYHALKEEQRRHRDAELAAREAELHALRYQSHPHFLFNVLNGVSVLVAENRGDEARAMIAQISTFLRATLDGQAHEIPLAEELALTETCLSIEQAWLGERLQVRWKVGPGVLDADVPALLLQPWWRTRSAMASPGAARREASTSLSGGATTGCGCGCTTTARTRRRAMPRLALNWDSRTCVRGWRGCIREATAFPRWCWHPAATR